MAVNTLHWHDASKELPLALTDEENEALIVAHDKDDNNLTWDAAVRKDGKWVGNIRLEVNGKEFIYAPLIEDVKYWAYFPTCDFTR